MKKLYIAGLILSVILFFGCGNNQNQSAHAHDHGEETEHNHEGHEHESEEKHDHEGHDHGAEGDHDHDHEGEEAHAEKAKHAGEVVFTKAQAEKTDFELIKIEPTTFNEIIRASGQVLPAQGDEASVVATVSGIVSFSAKKISDGAAVRAGETLFHISSRNIAEGDYTARTRAAYEQAKAAYERAENLIKDQIISQADYEKAKLDYENAKAANSAVSDKTTAKGVGIGSPIGGFIKNIAVTEGQYVEVGQQLATVSQNRRLTLRADVSQKYANALRSVSSANFKTTYDNRLYSLKDLGGRLLSVGKASDGNSAYIPVTFEFDNKGDVVSGSFVDVYLISSPRAGVIAVPIGALIEEQGIYSVYVQIDEEGYMKREVKTGADNGREIEILSGLQPGETIVGKGVYQVKLASATGAIPHGHTH